MDASTATLVAASVAALASIVGVFVSVYVAHFNAKRTSNLKIMEFRRDWVENLRMKIADTASLRFFYDQAHDVLMGLDCDHVEESDKLHREKIRIMQEMGRNLTFVQLCLNPNEEAHVELQSKMEFLVRGSKKEHDEAIKAGEFGLLSASRKVLKKEWNRLKAEA